MPIIQQHAHQDVSLALNLYTVCGISPFCLPLCTCACAPIVHHTQLHERAAADLQLQVTQWSVAMQRLQTEAATRTGHDAQLIRDLELQVSGALGGKMR